MASWKSRIEREEKLDKLQLCYKVADGNGYEKTNAENLDQIKEILFSMGVILDVKDGSLFINVMGDRYYRKKTRNAGRRETYGKVDYRKAEGFSFGDLCLYSDVVWMSQSMTDKQIAEKIGMKIATYYRHKKNMKNSIYYNSLDLNKLNDREYLESVSGNYCF